MQAANRLMLMGKKSALGFGADKLAALSWTAGASTTLSTAGGFARALSTTTTPPRIFKGPIALTAGKTYKFGGTAYQRTAATNMFFRVSTLADISTGDIYQNTSGGTSIPLTGVTFIAGSNVNVYLGIVAVIVAQGEYSEIDDAFTLQESL